MGYTPDQLRKVMIPIGTVGYAITAVIVDAIQNHPDQLWQVTAWSAVAAAVQAFLVFWPSNPWVKFAGGAVGAVAVVIASAITDGRVTLGEAGIIAAAFLGWIASGMVENEPVPAAVALAK